MTLKRAWWNGRHARLRIWFRKEWRFKSSRAHHFQKIVKHFFTGPLVKTELLVVMLEKHGIAATQEFVDATAPDDGDLDRAANVLVPEADFARARELFFTEREDEL